MSFFIRIPSRYDVQVVDGKMYVICTRCRRSRKPIDGLLGRGVEPLLGVDEIVRVCEEHEREMNH